MNPNDPNIRLLAIVADRLGEALREELVFVGGAIAGLLITDPAMPAIRATDDVDLVCKAVARPDYYRVETALRAQGFLNDSRPGAPICRWRVEEGLVSVAVDVMPSQDDIFGFANCWYPLAMETAQQILLSEGCAIRVIAAPVFLATKLEAFEGRGGGDFLSSHDLEDLLAIVDGRASLLDECRTSALALRSGLATHFRRLLANSAFIEALPGHLPSDAASQARLPELLATLQQLAGLETP